MSDRSGELEGVRSYQHLGLSGDQSLYDLNRYSRARYQRVVNIREINEADYSKEQFLLEKESFLAQGLEFYHIPFSRQKVAEGAVDEEMLEEIRAALPSQEEASMAKTLIYCSSGARAAAFMAWYLHEVEGMDWPKAREKAYKLGPQDENALKALEAVEKGLF